MEAAQVLYSTSVANTSLSQAHSPATFYSKQLTQPRAADIHSNLVYILRAERRNTNRFEEGLISLRAALCFSAGLTTHCRSAQVILSARQACRRAFTPAASRCTAPTGQAVAEVSTSARHPAAFWARCAQCLLSSIWAHRWFAGNDSTLPGCHSLNYTLIRHQSTWAREHQLSERGLSQPAQTSSFSADWVHAKASFQPLRCHGKRATLPSFAAWEREGRYRFILGVWKAKPCISWMNLWLLYQITS